MATNKQKKHSIVARIFFLFMLVICLQAFLSVNTILFTDIATTVESYTYNSFTRTVMNRKSNLESFMSASWSNISEISSTVSQRYQDMAAQNGSLSEEEKIVYLSNSVDDVVQMMAMTGTTGGFLILDDGENMKYSYSNIYLKSYDNLNQVVNRDNLVMVRGPGEVSKEHGFSLASNWSYGLSLTEETFPILNIPSEATSQTKKLEYLGYWHISTDISNDNFQVLTCSMPILDEEGNSIGVVGIEVSQEYLYKFLPDNEFADVGSFGYLFGNIEEIEGETTLTPSLFHGTVQNNLFDLSETISVGSLILDGHDLDAIPKILQVQDEDICVYYEPLNIYTNNSPFLDHPIWLVGMIDFENITSFTDTFWDVIETMVGVSLGAGIVIAYVVGRGVAQPIMKLRKEVSTQDVQETFTFTPTNILEIDELASVIQQMQENILRSAGRTDKILQLLNIGVGSFEYEKDTNIVTVSTAVYKMLDLEDYSGKLVPKDVFFEKLELLKSNPMEEVKNTFSVGSTDIKYYKIEEFQQDNVLLGVIEDTTKDMEALLVLNYERNYDLLTGIFNRRAFHQKANEALKMENLGVAGFVMFDLDNLKYVNDTFGHDSGDVYIKRAATTIHGALHKYGVVGRMSGDEFYAFLYGFESKSALMASLDHLYARFEKEPIEMPNSTEFKIRVSGGIAWYGEDSSDLEELKKYADFAMYKGKHTLKGEMRQFDREMYLEESFMLSGKAELNRLLDSELLNFVYQPIIDIKTGNIYGYEALMRPISDILATPPKLLQLATLEGKLWKVEKIALFKTLSLFKKHCDLFQNARLFINSIPSETLKDEEYEEIKGLYQDCLPQIVIEITEQEQQNDSFMENKLSKLRSLDLDIAIDDYGSGYANDLGLIKIKPDIVKIDRSLISNVHVDPSRQTIVHKIITICKEQNISVLGEGIETEQELEYLIHAGIELAQGYYISRPMDLPSFDTSEITAKLEEIHKK